MKTTHAPATSGRKIPRRIIRQASTFVIVCLFLLLLNCMTSPGHWWVVWVVAGWGLHLAILLVHHWIGWDEEEQRR